MGEVSSDSPKALQAFCSVQTAHYLLHEIEVANFLYIREKKYQRLTVLSIICFHIDSRNLPYAVVEYPIVSNNTSGRVFCSGPMELITSANPSGTDSFSRRRLP